MDTYIFMFEKNPYLPWFLAWNSKHVHFLSLLPIIYFKKIIRNVVITSSVLSAQAYPFEHLIVTAFFSLTIYVPQFYPKCSTNLVCLFYKYNRRGGLCLPITTSSVTQKHRRGREGDLHCKIGLVNSEQRNMLKRREDHLQRDKHMRTYRYWENTTRSTLLGNVPLKTNQCVPKKDRSEARLGSLCLLCSGV